MDEYMGACKIPKRFLEIMVREELLRNGTYFVQVANAQSKAIWSNKTNGKAK